MGIPNDSIIIAYIGGFTLARAIIPLIKASSNFKDVSLLIAGDGPQRAAIEKAIIDHPNILYFGWIKQELVPAYTMLSDIIYYGLNITDGNSQYSNPNTLFNAMAAGKPILTTDVGEIARIVKMEDCGIVISDATPESVADGIRQLTNPVYRQRLGEMEKGLLTINIIGNLQKEK